MLSATMAAHVGERFAHNPGNLAASSGRKSHLGRVADELRADAGVLAVSGYHARQEFDQVPRIELNRLELMDQVANVGGFILHELLYFDQLLLAFFGGTSR